jgi:hypothetical protein
MSGINGQNEWSNEWSEGNGQMNVPNGQMNGQNEWSK